MLHASGVLLVVREVVDAKALVQEDLGLDLGEPAGKRVPTAKDPGDLGMPTRTARIEERSRLTRFRRN